MSYDDVAGVTRQIADTARKLWSEIDTARCLPDELVAMLRDTSPSPNTSRRNQATSSPLTLPPWMSELMIVLLLSTANAIGFDIFHHPFRPFYGRLALLGVRLGRNIFQVVNQLRHVRAQLRSGKEAWLREDERAPARSSLGRLLPK